MLKYYDLNKTLIGGLKNCKDLKVESELSSGDKQLSFLWHINNKIKMCLECYIRTDTDEFVIKENSKGSNGYRKIVANLNLEDLEGKAMEKFEAVEHTVKECADMALSGTGWRCICTMDKRRGMKLTKVTALDVLNTICKAFLVEVRFDTINKMVYFQEEIGDDRGVYFTKSLNLKEVIDSTDTYDYFTQILPIGKDGLKIDGINGGKAYLENYQYSSKKKMLIWEDSRYETAEALKEDAQKKLAEISKSKKSYQSKVIDLSKQSEKYSVLSYSLGDTVTLIENETDLFEKQRIVKITEYLNDPTKNTCELSNATLTFEEMQSRLFEAADIVNNITEDNGTVKVYATDIKGLEDYLNGNQKIKDLTTQYLYVSGELGALKASFGEMQTTYLKATDAEITYLKVEKAEADYLKIEVAEANYIKTNVFEALDATVKKINGDFLTFKSGEFETLKSKQAAFEEATAQKFTAANGSIDNLTGQFATFKELTTTNFTAVTGNIKDLTVESQRVKTLLAGNITSENIATGAITAGSGIIANGAIGDAEISNLSANKIKSGTVDTSLVTIASKDSAITITGNQLMVNDTTNTANPINRVILGKYTSGSATTYGLLIRGKDGKTVMLDGDGVHNAGITNGAVDNNKVADDANISGNKLDINSVVRSVNGATEKIQSTVVQVGDRSLNVYLGEQTNTITEHGESLRTQASSIKAAQDSIKFKLDTQTWTTAKEEIDGKISKNTSNLSKATSDITVLQGQITSKVEQTDINKAVESITIGGRNLFTKSNLNKYSNLEQWTINGYATGALDSVNKYNGYTSIKLVTTNATGMNSKKITLLKGKTYTWSFYIKATEAFVPSSIKIMHMQLSDGSNIHCEVNRRFSPSNVLANTWTKVSATFDTPTTAETYTWSGYIWFLTNNQTYNVCCFKLEEGNKATDYTEAPEDVDSQIAEVTTTTTESIKTAKSEIKQTTDAITQNVSNLQSTVSTHTTQIANKAETSTVTAISNRTASLETKLTGITGKVTDYVSTTVTNSTKDLVTGLETVNSSIETINSKQAGFELTLDGFATDVSSLEKSVEKKADGSALSALSNTVSGLSSNLDGFKTSVSSTYTTKTELSNTLGSYSTTTQMNSAIEATKSAITSSVSETYSTKAELTSATGKITALETWKQEASQKITKDGIVATVGSYYAKDTDLTAAENRITSVETKATQTADKFNWIVKSGTSATNFTITDRLISLTTASIDLSATNLVSIISGGSAKIQAKNITLDGLVTANSNFKILADGSMEAKNGKFTGDVNATKARVKESYSIYCEDDGSDINIITASGWSKNDETDKKVIFGIDTTKNQSTWGLPYILMQKVNDAMTPNYSAISMNAQKMTMNIMKDLFIYAADKVNIKSILDVEGEIRQNGISLTTALNNKIEFKPATTLQFADSTVTAQHYNNQQVIGDRVFVEISFKTARNLTANQQIKFKNYWTPVSDYDLRFITYDSGLQFMASVSSYSNSFYLIPTTNIGTNVWIRGQLSYRTTGTIHA
ncbi:phage tail spike protein [Robinsoniella peoriensis]|uniref:phage tail spike protein n=1 Tax=Robinsoniella peoriensis TaxID=180332 RepID=UPI00362F0922